VLLTLDRPTEAIEASEGLTLPGEAGIRARLARGRALVAAGRSLDARPDLRALLDTKVGDEARYWLAVGGRDRGDTKAAIATFRRTWVVSTLGPWSERSAEALAALDAPVPDLGSEEGRALVMERVAALKGAQRHQEALQLMQQVRASQGDTAPTHDLAYALFRARDYPTAVATWAELMGAPDTATGPAQALFDYALGTSRTGDYDTAATIYRRVIAQHAGTRRGDEASYKLGYLEYDRAACDKAVPLFEQHLERYPSSRYLESTLWFTGRCHWRQGRRATAVKAWDRLVSAKPRSSLAPAVAYWKARLLELDGEEDAARDALEGVISKYPVSGHAWFAAQRLERTFPATAAVPAPSWPSALADREEVRRADALLAAGFRTWAADELRPLIRTAKDLGRDAALATAHALIRAGAYREGAKLAKPYCVSPWKGGDPVAQQACHPRAEASIVTATARRYGLPPLVPFGIMWSESAMTPHVTSIAGARGLMQLMPREGQRLHDEAFGQGTFDPDNLYLAPYNARLGTTELGTKRQALEGVLTYDSLPAAIASYNAGLEAVQRWLGAYDSPAPFDVFAEDISYTETRRYVRGVLGHYMTYRWVYGDAE
jgi:soluble lytic murein transglycosylase